MEKREVSENSSPLYTVKKSPQDAARTAPPSRRSHRIIRGEVVIQDITGEAIYRTPVSLVGSGWVALPRRKCLGGKKWTLTLNSGQEFNIVEGIQREADQIGLWRVENSDRINSMTLVAWNRNAPLTWLASAPGRPAPEILPDHFIEQVLFTECTLPEPATEPGLLIQDNKVVGWCLEASGGVGYLWNGPDSDWIEPEIGVEDFYYLTFGNGREEALLEALAMDENHSASIRLSAFADAFRRSPKLSGADSVSFFDSYAIIAHMRTLTAELMQNGLYGNIADILYEQILIEANDLLLLMDVVAAAARGYGFENAVMLIENVGNAVQTQDETQRSQLKQLHFQLYRNQVIQLLNNGELDTAQDVLEAGLEYFADNCELYLLGADLALMKGDWAEAERRLTMKDCPSSFNDKAARLRARIAELKGQAGKIIVRFQPGSRYIPVEAVLGGTVRQGFIVDTGASMLTVPTSTAEALGVELDDQVPMQRVATAGGVQKAPRIIIPSIRLGEFEVYDIEALVLDIPQMPEAGLLGLNYLNRFKMDLNSEKGILLLTPR